MGQRRRPLLGGHADDRGPLTRHVTAIRAQAALLRAIGAPYSLETIEVAAPRPGEVRIAVLAAGHCHTDVLAHTGRFVLPLPAILGHEGAGVVEAVGEGVTSLHEGDHVLLSFGSCGACRNCSGGHPSACAELGARNVTGLHRDGSTPVTTEAGGEAVAARWFSQSSFATHCIAEERNAVRVEPDLPLHLLAPLGCSIQTGAGTVLHVLRPGAGSSIAVFGTGAVGLAAVMAARIEGCATVVAVDRNAERLELAASLGATHTVLAGADTEAQVREAAGSLDCAFDTTGDAAVLAAAMGALRPGGVLATAAANSADPPEPTEERSVVQVMEGDSDPQRFIPQLVEHWRAGRLPLDRLVTTFPLADIDAAEGAARAGSVVKPVLLPSH